MEVFKKNVAGRGTCMPYNDMYISSTSKLHPTYPNLFTYNNIEYKSLEHCISLNINEKSSVVFKYFHINFAFMILLVEKKTIKYIIENDIFNLSNIYYSLHHCFYTLKHFAHIRENESLQLENM